MTSATKWQKDMGAPRKQQREFLQKKIRKAYGAFAIENECVPLYADCEITFRDDGVKRDRYFKLNTEEDANDESIFYYCTGLSDLLDLCYGEREEFMVTRLNALTNEIF